MLSLDDAVRNAWDGLSGKEADSFYSGMLSTRSEVINSTEPDRFSNGAIFATKKGGLQKTMSQGISSSAMQFSSTEPQIELSSDQLALWRAKIHECRHPMMVLNSNFQPILLNDALRARLSEPSGAESSNQPIAFVWQAICETAARLAANTAAAGAAEIAEAFPIDHRCFVAVGSLLRCATSGNVIGAVLNLSDLTTGGALMREVFGKESGVETGDSADGYQEWMTQRQQAGQKMARLSRREYQVVSLVADGLPNKSIARELDISVKTIEKHRANATRKLGVGSTAEMVRLAVIADGKPAVVPRNEAEAL